MLVVAPAADHAVGRRVRPVQPEERRQRRVDLICSGAKGRLFEVGPTGDLLWESTSPYASSGGFSESRVDFRAYRLPYHWHTTALSRWMPVEQLPGGPSLVSSGIPGTALKTK